MKKLRRTRGRASDIVSTVHASDNDSFYSKSPGIEARLRTTGEERFENAPLRRLSCD